MDVKKGEAYVVYSINNGEGYILYLWGIFIVGVSSIFLRSIFNTLGSIFNTLRSIFDTLRRGGLKYT